MKIQVLCLDDASCGFVHVVSSLVIVASDHISDMLFIQCRY